MAESSSAINQSDACQSLVHSVNNNVNGASICHDSPPLVAVPVTPKQKATIKTSSNLSSADAHISSNSKDNGKPSITVSAELNGNSLNDASPGAEIGETMSMTSKTSRTSQFARRLSMRKSRATSWLSARFRRHQKNNDLSATFNLLDQENKSMLVDLNKATEEELMTVSGITRFIARSIVEYRTAIGGFRRLQDLALVSGVGAAKMAQLGRDLTITEKVEEASDGDSDQDSTTTTTAVATPSSAPVPATSPLPYSLKPPSSSVPGSHLSTPYSSVSSNSPAPMLEAPITSLPKGTPLKKVNVNLASIFELMTVPGVNQEMAAQIVHHRDKKGPFKTVEDISKVRGIRPRAARHVLPHLMVDSCTSSPASSQSDTANIAVPSPHTPVSKSSCVNYNGGCAPDATPERRPSNKYLYRTRHHGHRRTLSAPSNHNNQLLSPVIGVAPSNLRDTDVLLKVIEQAGYDSQLDSPRITGHRLSLEFTSDVYELLSLRSERPEIHGLFENMHKGRSAVRVATWSLCHLTPDKLSNPGVLEVLCRTVLERGFSIIAVQDIIGPNLLPRICNELNVGTLRRVREWPGKQGAWACRVSPAPVSRYSFRREASTTCNEYVGFLYNEKFVDLLQDSILDTPGNHAVVSQPHLGVFRSNNLTFSIVNLHGKLQSYIDRSESFLQTCDHFLKPLCANETSGVDASEDQLPSPNEKSARNVQNGIIKDLSINSSDENNSPTIAAGAGGGSSEGREVKQRLEFTQSGDARHLQLQEALTAVWQHLRSSVLDKGAVILLGNFGVAPDSAGMCELANLGYSSVLSAEVSTVLCSSTSSAPPQLHTDQLWLSPALLQHHYTGEFSTTTLSQQLHQDFSSPEELYLKPTAKQRKKKPAILSADRMGANNPRTAKNSTTRYVPALYRQDFSTPVLDVKTRAEERRINNLQNIQRPKNATAAWSEQASAIWPSPAGGAGEASLPPTAPSMLTSTQTSLSNPRLPALDICSLVVRDGNRTTT
ncbi:RuvA domain 2-like [Trinorchestia longiramus]|nr:RuvA domain 2-like [Trinorchestia longiramus]